MVSTAEATSKQERVAFGSLGGKALLDEVTRGRKWDASEAEIVQANLLELVNAPEEELREYLTTEVGYDQKTSKRYIKLLKSIREYLIATTEGRKDFGVLGQLLAEFAHMPATPINNETKLWCLLCATLFLEAATADQSNIYVCGECGKLGRANRSSKRWCSDKCRMRATRRQNSRT